MFTYHPGLTAHSTQPPFTNSLKLHFPAEASQMKSTLRVRPSRFLLTYLVSSGCGLFSDPVLLLWTVCKSLLTSTAASCKLETSLSPKAVPPRLLRTWGTGGTYSHRGSLCTYMQTYHLKVPWAASTLVCDLTPWYIQQSKLITFTNLITWSFAI